MNFLYNKHNKYNLHYRKNTKKTINKKKKQK